MATSVKHNGWKRLVDSSYSELAVYSAGLKRLEFANSRTFLSTEGGVLPANCVLFGTGNTTTRTTTTTDNKGFLWFVLNNAATSGYCHGLYISLTNASTATEISAGRFVARNTGTVTSGSLHALWATIEEVSGTNSGLTAAGRFTQTCAASQSMTGTRTCLQLDATYPSTATLAGNESFLRAENVGASAKKIPYFMQFVAPDTTDMFVTCTTEANYAKGLKISVDGVPYWVMLASAAG